MSITLRVNPTTSQTYEALRANAMRISQALGNANTNTAVLARLDTELAELAGHARQLRVALRQEIRRAK